MTAIVTTPAAAGSTLKVTQARVLRSEWTKFRSVRSSIWTLLVAVVLTIGFGALISAVQADHYSQMDADRRVRFSPVAVSLAGMNFAELAIGVLGVLVISAEYSTGMIRASLTSVPKRLAVLWAKLIVTTGASLVVMTMTSFIAFFIGQALLDSHDLGTSITAAGALRQVVGAAIAVTAMAAIGITFGALLRNTAAAISTFVAVFFVFPPLMDLLPSSISDNLDRYLPSEAASALFASATDNANLLGFWSGFAVLAGYIVVLVGAAAALLHTRDA